MANTLDERIMVINTEGIISVKPIWIRKIIHRPDGTSEGATFTFWDESDSPVSTKIGQTTSVTDSTKKFESTSNFPTGTINPNQIVRFSSSSTDENLYTFQIDTNVGNNEIVVDELNTIHGTITNDSSELYSWKVWNPHTAFTFLSPASEKRYGEIDFRGKGYLFPNLAMHSLTASNTFLIYVE